MQDPDALIANEQMKLQRDNQYYRLVLDERDRQLKVRIPRRCCGLINCLFFWEEEGFTRTRPFRQPSPIFSVIASCWQQRSKRISEYSINQVILKCIDNSVSVQESFCFCLRDEQSRGSTETV